MHQICKRFNRRNYKEIELSHSKIIIYDQCSQTFPTRVFSLLKKMVLFFIKNRHLIHTKQFFEDFVRNKSMLYTQYQRLWWVRWCCFEPRHQKLTWHLKKYGSQDKQRLFFLFVFQYPFIETRITRYKS